MKVFLILMFLLVLSCFRPETVRKTEYYKLTDSISVVRSENAELVRKIAILRDSISVLKERPLMNSDQFIQLYKYGRLNKYYQICKKNPTQWKYYKGWSIRVFEQ